MVLKAWYEKDITLRAVPLIDMTAVLLALIYIPAKEVTANEPQYCFV